MRLLTHTPPAHVRICGQRVRIRTHFGVGILWEEMMLDNALSDEEKARRTLQLYYPRLPAAPRAAAEGLRAAFWFWRCGAPAPAGQAATAAEARPFSFVHDDALIYAAFYSAYGIDLCRAKHLHWWQFCALFSALKADELFCKVVHWRTADPAAFLGEEGQFLRKMKKLYALPAPPGENERHKAIARALMDSGKIGTLAFGPTKEE